VQSQAEGLADWNRTLEMLESRRYVASMFCDMHGFTVFSEHPEPKEVMDILKQYHRQLGALVSEHQWFAS
jgi:class 3 adenylate cyclase